MSNDQRIKIPRMPDRAVIDCFKKLADKYGVSNISISALGFSQIGSVDINGEGNEEFKTLIEHNSTLIDTVSMQIGGLTIIYSRGGQYPPEQKSPVFDEIVLRWNAQQGDLSNKDKLDIIALINSELKAFEPGRFIETGLSEEQNQLLSIHEATLERLERLNEDLIRKSSEYREGLENRYDSKVLELEKQVLDKKEKLDADHENRTTAIDEKDKLLTNKLDAIDDRDNTHVRREIRDKMLTDVKSRIEKFGVSKSTEKKRSPVFIGIVVMILAIGIMLLLSILELHQLTLPSTSDSVAGSANLYWIWAKITILSFGLLGTILYYVKWQNKWAEQHANSEFQLQQFYIDVNRANWVIESCLEWRKETDSAIPTVLLESITRDLFENGSDELDGVVHPSDALASALLGSASKLKMKIGDNELEFDKPGKISKKQAKTN